MRFDYKAYEQVFPREDTPAPVESAVENFTPSDEIDDGDDNVDEIDEEPELEGANDDGNE